MISLKHLVKRFTSLGILTFHSRSISFSYCLLQGMPANPYNVNIADFKIIVGIKRWDLISGSGRKTRESTVHDSFPTFPENIFF